MLLFRTLEDVGSLPRTFVSMEGAKHCHNFDNKKHRSNCGDPHLVPCHGAYSDVGSYPEDSIYRRALGGGAVTVLSPYLLQAASLAYPGVQPSVIVATGVPAGDPSCGELSGGAVLAFPPPSAVGSAIAGAGEHHGRGGLAVCVSGFTCETAEVATFACASGRVVLESPAHCPIAVTCTVRYVFFICAEIARTHLEIFNQNDARFLAL